MSALDMVLQRQVPTRSPARAGDGLSGGDTAGGSKADAFSAALSNESRNSLPERDRVASDSEIKADNDGAVADEQVSSQSGQPDDILNLLAGLKSSASYSDEAALGASNVEEDLDPESGVQAAQDALAPAAKKAADGESVPDDELVVRAEGVDNVDVDVDVVAKAGLDQLPAPQAASQQVSDAKVAPTPNGASSTDAGAKAAVQSTAAPGTSDIKTAQASVESKSTPATPPVQVAAAAGPAAQSVSTQQKPSAAPAAADQQKSPSSLKEAMQALGLEERAVQSDAVGAREEGRGRSAGKQSGADDKRIDELTNKKDGKVEVIESRRFMPSQNLSANGQMLTRSLAEASSGALASQRVSSAQPATQTGLPQAGQTLHTLKLQLNPISLGSVTAVLKLSGEELSVEIKVQTAEAYRQLKDDNQSILKALRGQGFGVEQITVQHVVGTERASGQAAQQGFQGGQQGPGANDAQSSGREGSGNNAGQQQSGSQRGQSHEQSSYTGTGAARNDGVYL